MDALKNVPPERLKKLEERFISKFENDNLGPSNNSNIISQTDTFMNNEVIQKEINDAKSNSVIQNFSKKETLQNQEKEKDQKLNFFDGSGEKSKLSDKNNNSSKSVFTRKSNKVEKRNLNTNNQNIMNNFIKSNNKDSNSEFLNNKRMRFNNESSNNFSIFCNEKLSIDDQIEFSSKNVVSSSKLFSKDSKGDSSKSSAFSNKNKGKLDHYFSSANSVSTKDINSTLNSAASLNAKINSYFPTMNQPTMESLQKQLIALKEKNDQLMDEIAKIVKDYNEKKRLYDKEIEKLIEENNETKDNLMNFTQQFTQMQNQFSQTKIKLIKYLRELEEIKRKEKKKWLYETGYKVYRQGLQRMSSKMVEVWEDGEDIINLKRRVAEIMQEKAALEKDWNKAIQAKKNQVKENNETVVKSNNNIVIDKYEEEDKLRLINFRMQRLNTEESEIKEKLEKLDQEKIHYQLQFKRINDEAVSRYGSPTSKERWPVLNNKYLILSLLGKGGYSEVYKAYDLENNIEVACKIHELNSSWTYTMRDCYIKHAIRENEIYKQIKHPKVVNHYDTFEIDQNSFCSVLELCSGPDLYTYLKLHKTIPEKEARYIITQLLSALKYLNERENKIIHFDLKPQNILFHNGEVKIADFGLAKIMDDKDQIELTSQGVGTYWYLPPECFEMDKNKPLIDSKVDIWSTGVIFYELLFGQKPFGNGMTQEKIFQENVIRRAKKVEFPEKPIVSPECKDFIKKCLCYNRFERFDVQAAWNSTYIRNQKL